MMRKTDIAVIGGGLSGMMVCSTLKVLGREICLIDGRDCLCEIDDFYIFHLHEIPSKAFPGNVEYVKHIAKTGIWYSDDMYRTSMPFLSNFYSIKSYGELCITNVDNLTGMMDILVPYAERYKGLKTRSLLSNIFFDELKDYKRFNTYLGNEIVGLDLINKVLFFSDGSKMAYNLLVSTTPLNKFLDFFREKNKDLWDKILDRFPESWNRSYPFCSASISLGGNSNLYQVIFNADLACNITRIFFVSDRIFIETTCKEGKFPGLTDKDFKFLYSVGFGFLIDDFERADFKVVFPGKFFPLDKTFRKHLFRFFTEHHDIYFLGRYATWSYKVANMVWQDSFYIKDLIEFKSLSNVFLEDKI